MLHEKPQSLRRYRLSRHCLIIGLIGVVFFSGIGAFSVYAAFWNIDGSFPHPKIHAFVYLVFWSCWNALAILLIIAYFRTWLCVTADKVMQQGVVFYRELYVADVSAVTWKGIPQAGKIILRSKDTRIKVDLGNFTTRDRTELIQSARDQFDTGVQIGWSRFNRTISSRPDATPEAARRTATICALLFFILGVSLILVAWLNLGVEWYFAGGGCIVAACWYAHRIRQHYRKSAG